MPPSSTVRRGVGVSRWCSPTPPKPGVLASMAAITRNAVSSSHGLRC